MEWMETKKVFSKIGWVYTIVSVLIVALQALLIGLVDFLKPEWFSLETELIISSGVLYVVGLLVFSVGLKDIPCDKIAKKKMSVRSFIKASFMCYALLIITNLIGTLFTTAIGAIKGSPIINPVEELAMNADMTLLFVLTVIAAPIFEELFFRKFLIDRMVVYGEWISVVISGLMFGLFHGNLSQFPYAFALGAFFAYIYIRTGKIIYPIIMHAIINFMGSIVGTYILRNVDLSFYDKILNLNLTQSIMEVLTFDNIAGILILLGYELLLFAFVAIGIIFWILEFKKFRFEVQDKELPVAQRFETSICCRGMVAFIAFWVIMIIISFF